MSDFTPTLWPEHSPPPPVRNCQRCELYKQRSRVIWGEGNPYAPIVVILDNPGAREDREGRTFVCGARLALQEGVFAAGLTMDDLYVTYLLKCRPRYKYDKELARRTCKGYLLEQIEEQQPRLGFCLGDTAVQWFFDDLTLSVKELRGRWHVVRGLQTAVSYHPLAIRRRPTLRPFFEEDWQLLAKGMKHGDGSFASF